MAAPSFSGSSEFQMHRPRGVCAACGALIEPGEPFIGALLETPQGFERIDVKLEHWDAFDRTSVAAYWRSKMPLKEQAKKKLLVDDTVLLELLERLSDVQEPAKLAFRFVLMLILMRKRLVAYESQRVEAGQEVWRVKVRGKDLWLEVIDPKPTEEQIAQLQEQLGQILSGEA